MRPSQLLSVLLALSSFSVAWPWPPSLDSLKAFQNLEDILFRRQQNQNHASSSAAPSAHKTTVVKQSQTPTPIPSASQTSHPKSGPAKTSSNGKSSAHKTGATSAASQTTLAPISPVDPAGGVSMISPAITSGAQYYKIGQYVTFAWNYTYLLRNPKAINVLAALSQSNANGGAGNTATFTLTQNMTFDPTPTLLWDTGKWSTSATPLAPGTYTLIIYDAQASGGVSAVPQAGYLGLYDQYTFGMYTTSLYTVLSPQYQCATCNSAFGSIERMAMGFLFAMAGITVLSFTWFATGSGLLF